MWLFLLFVIVPIVEIILFIKLGGILGLWNTLGVIVLTAVVGTFLVKNQGLAILTEIQANLSQLRNPIESLAHGALILIAGLLLLTPGFFTDAIGFSFLIPKVRGFLYLWLQKRFKLKTFSSQGVSQKESPHHSSTIIDGEYSDLDEAP